MSKLRVGVVDPLIASRPTVTTSTTSNYITAVMAGADSVWVPDHINQLFPRSLWKPQYCGVAKILPAADAYLEPWTMLGHLSARNRVRRLHLGVGVTDTGRRNPAVTAQAAATLHLLSRGRAILGIGTGEREGNEPYGVDWTRPVARFEEAMATIRALWDSKGQLVNRDSEFFPLHNAIFDLPPYHGTWPPIWIAAHGPRMMRATGRYADGWFPGTTRADEYGEQLSLVRTAASDAGRNPMDITPALIRFIVTGRSRDEVDEVVQSDIAKVFTLNCDGEAWARHGAEHPLGSDFAGSQDLIPQLIDEQTALGYAAKAPRSLVEELFAVGTPDEVIEQMAEFRDYGMRYLVVGNAGAIQPSLRKSAATTAPYIKLVRGLRKL